jgi:3-hydroxymyristoyl/3-hydroxydecanoyl-(acyl carrier protein) dehydratase
MASLFQAVGACLTGAERTPAGEFAAGFVCPEAFVGFQGHFPDRPILPGIAQIMAVLHACAAVPPVLRGVKSCKFLRPVGPGEAIEVRGSVSQDGETLAITAAVTAGEALCASMTLTAHAAPGEED